MILLGLFHLFLSLEEENPPIYTFLLFPPPEDEKLNDGFCRSMVYLGSGREGAAG